MTKRRDFFHYERRYWPIKIPTVLTSECVLLKIEPAPFGIMRLFLPLTSGTVVDFEGLLYHALVKNAHFVFFSPKTHHPVTNVAAITLYFIVWF